MEGLFFFWILWVYWIGFTFFVNKQNSFRFKVSAVILVCIIIAEFRLPVGNFVVYAGGLFILLLSYFILSKQTLGALLYSFICSFIITIAYVTFNLFEIFDPIWILFEKKWMMGICFTYLAILLQKSLKGRLLIIISGTMQGEILYSYYLNRFQLSYPIGSLSYLDVCSLISLLLVCWTFLENAGVLFQNHIHFSEKGKQKSS